MCILNMTKYLNKLFVSFCDNSSDIFRFLSTDRETHKTHLEDSSLLRVVPITIESVRENKILVQCYDSKLI